MHTREGTWTFTREVKLWKSQIYLTFCYLPNYVISKKIFLTTFQVSFAYFCKFWILLCCRQEKVIFTDIIKDVF